MTGLEKDCWDELGFFTAEPLARVGARGRGRRLQVEGSDKEDVVTFFEDVPQTMKTRVGGGVQ